MKIGINALFRLKPTGVANYICNLVYCLSEIDEENEYVVFTTVENRQYFPIQKNNFNVIFCKLISESPAYRRFWEQSVFPWLIRSEKVELLHCLMNVLPIWPGCPTVLTIIDTQYFKHPEFFSFLRRNYLKNMMGLSLAQADGVITISRAVKNEMNECFSWLKKKEIAVIELGLSPCFKVINDSNKISDTKKKYGIEGKYILFIGYPHFRKNLLRLIGAFKQVLASYSEPCTLVIVGEMREEESDIKNVYNVIENFGIKGKVIFTGYVPGASIPGHMDKQDIVYLLNGAELLAFPSIYEGFGLPVLEAMACGTPVLVSDIPVMHEIAHEAAIFVDPYDINDIADGISRGLKDGLLRKNLRQRGLDKAKKFSWKINALKTLEYYKRVFENQKRKSADD